MWLEALSITIISSYNGIGFGHVSVSWTFIGFNRRLLPLLPIARVHTTRMLQEEEDED